MQGENSLYVFLLKTTVLWRSSGQTSCPVMTMLTPTRTDFILHDKIREGGEGGSRNGNSLPISPTFWYLWYVSSFKLTAHATVKLSQQ